MLQWMGGSRRKVASTRKSVQSRQKQYFEQKRLQQQATGGGKAFEENSIQGKHSENNRSLDVLSLQGLSKVPQDHKLACDLATASNEVDHESPNCQRVQHLQLLGRFQHNENKSPIPSKIDETDTSVRTPADRIKMFNSNNDKNSLKLQPEQEELCIIDMLGDEDPNVCSTKNLKPEDHAAFSIEGLGEVDMEDPSRTSVHSPKAHCRTFLHGCSSPSEAMRLAYSFNLDTKPVDLEFELDTMMAEADVTLCKSSMERSFNPEDRPDSYCKSKQGCFYSEDHLPFNDDKSSFGSPLTMMPEVNVTLCKSSMDHSFGPGDRRDLFCKSKQKQRLFDSEDHSPFNGNKNIFDTIMPEVDVTFCKSSMEHSFGPGDRSDLFCNLKQKLFDSEDHSPFNGNENSFNDLLEDEELFFNSRQSKRRILDAKPSTQSDQILDESDFRFPHDDWMNQRDASTGYVSGMNHRKKEFTFQESPQPKSRIFMRRSGKYSPEPYLVPQRSRASHNFALPDMTWYPPGRSCRDVRDFVDIRCHTCEDSRDNMSLPSEESCSSSAVKGASRKGSLNSKKKQSFERVDVTWPDNCVVYNMPGWERSHEINGQTTQAGENVTGQGKFTRTSNPLRSKPAHNSNLVPEKRLRPDDGRLFETAFDLSKATSARNSYFQESEPGEPFSCYSKLWFEDTFDASEGPKPYVSGSPAEKYSTLTADCSPFCNLELEEHNIGLPNLENSMLRPSMTNLSEDFDVGKRHLKSVHEQSFLASEQQSTTEVAEENADVPTSEHSKGELEGDTSSCGKSLSSKNENSRDTAGEDEYSDSQKYTDGPAKVDYEKDIPFLPHGEETSALAETSEINDGNWCHVDETIKLDAQTSLACPTKVAAEEFHPGGRKMEGKGQSSTDASGQVMMLNSFVMQFLCIQVMNEASAKGNRFDS